MAVQKKIAHLLALDVNMFQLSGVCVFDSNEGGFLTGADLGGGGDGASFDCFGADLSAVISAFLALFPGLGLKYFSKPLVPSQYSFHWSNSDSTAAILLRVAIPRVCRNQFSAYEGVMQ